MRGQQLSLTNRREPVNLQLQPSQASDAGTIVGQVDRADGTPVGGATAMLFTTEGQPFEHTPTNPAGRFNFPRVPKGVERSSSGERDEREAAVRSALSSRCKRGRSADAPGGAGGNRRLRHRRRR